jgi:hypothetical protein
MDTFREPPPFARAIAVRTRPPFGAGIACAEAAADWIAITYGYDSGSFPCSYP